MICPNCGKNVAATGEFCEYCGKPTQFSARMHDRPKEVPLPGPSAPEGNEAGGTVAIARKLDAIAKRISELPTLRTQRRTLLLTALLTLLLVAAMALFIGGAEKRLKREMALLLPTPTPTAQPTATPVPDYTVAYYADGADAATPLFPEETVAAGTSYTVTDELPEKPGFVFRGWNTRPDGGGAQYPAGSVYEFGQDLRLYAQWEPAPTPIPTPTPTPRPTPTATPATTQAPAETTPETALPNAAGASAEQPEALLPLQPGA